MSATVPVTTPRTPISYSEPANTLSHPEGSEAQLALGEGTYILRDIVTLGTVLPPPLETSTTAVNVLDTKPTPETANPKLSIFNLLDQSGIPQSNDIVTSSVEKQFGEDTLLRRGIPANGTSRLTHLASGNLKGYVRGNTFTSTTGPKSQSNRDSKELVKRRKPKASLLKSNSSMIARASPHEGLSKRIQDHKPENYFAFVNNSRAFLWLDFTSTSKAQQLTRILFARAHPLCHDVNPITKSMQHLDVIIGFSTSDIIWYESISQKYSHLNKHGVIHGLPISAIQWLPGSENLFLAAHVDGTIIIYDKEKEDAPFLPEESLEARPPVSDEEQRHPQIEVKRSLKAAVSKTNPVAVFKVTRQRVNAIQFSPDGRFLAVVSEDSSLRIIDLMREELIDLYSSYYGGITCVCWSPDSKYILTGGQDDMISIWSFDQRMLVARCIGHRSWVSALAFDRWRCDETNYRFGSVGEDRRLFLWDFSAGLIQRPRTASVRPSVVSFQRTESAMASRTSLKRSIEGPRVPDDNSEDEDDLIHQVEPRSQVSTLPPVFSKQVDEHPLSWVGFFEEFIVIACASGHIQTYDRPKTGEQSENESTESML